MNKRRWCFGRYCVTIPNELNFVGRLQVFCFCVRSFIRTSGIVDKINDSENSKYRRRNNKKNTVLLWRSPDHIAVVCVCWVLGAAIPIQNAKINVFSRLRFNGWRCLFNENHIQMKKRIKFRFRPEFRINYLDFECTSSVSPLSVSVAEKNGRQRMCFDFVRLKCNEFSKNGCSERAAKRTGA